MKQDAIMANVQKCMLADFLNLEIPLDAESEIPSRDAVEFLRSFKVGDDLDSYTFKQVYQAAAFLKRYRFQNDLFTNEELELLAEAKFVSNQARLRSIEPEAFKPWTKWILSRSRLWIKSVLGEYDEEYVQTHGRFSTKATAGVALRDASEAARWTIPVTGSCDHIKTFAAAMSNDELAYLEAQSPDESQWFDVRTVLKLVYVPKTHKSLRAIMPNTTLGSRQSDGQGKLIRQRLKCAGVDLARLQERNKELARLGSIDGNLVTVDQSSASDNLTTALVRYLLPAVWFDNLQLGRIGDVALPSGQVVRDSPTFCTMGIGFTFPLQTLIFQSLVEGLYMGLRKPRGVVSVYGDDMIFERDIYPFFKLLCQDIGLEVNDEKTFVDGPFRESCGGDYYHGLDVRPFSPERVDGDEVVGKRLESFLYKLLNGFTRRWHHLEIPSTVGYLTRLLSSLPSTVVVPPSFGDTAGIRWGEPVAPFGLTNCKPIRAGIYGYRFYGCRAVGLEVHVPDERALYWRRLSDMHCEEPQKQPHTVLEIIEAATGVTRDRVASLRRVKVLGLDGKPQTVRIRGRKADRKSVV